MKKRIIVAVLSLCAAFSLQAQQSLVGRVYYDQNIMKKLLDDAMTEANVDQKLREARDSAYIKAEKEAGERPAIKGKVENMAQYDVVFVCVPVWWYTAPMPVYTFLEQYDLKGKTVIPFCTAYSGPSSTLKDIVKATPESDHRDGICIVTKEMGGKDMESKHAKIDKWLTEIGF